MCFIYLITFISSLLQYKRIHSVAAPTSSHAQSLELNVNNKKRGVSFFLKKKRKKEKSDITTAMTAILVSLRAYGHLTTGYMCMITDTWRLICVSNETSEACRY